MAESFEHFVYCDTKDPVIGSDDGVQVAASSFSPGAEDDLQYWHELLHPLVSIHPRDTLCYFVSDERGQAALMYRTVEQSGRRQPFIHVLIGPQVELTPKIALGSFHWNWKGAIKKKSAWPSKMLPPITEEDRASFLAAADEGWYEASVSTGERPAELFRLIVKICEEGGLGEGPLSFTDHNELFSLGLNEFAILSAQDSGPDSVPLPIQVLARLLVMLGANNDDALSKGIIGSGFSTHEHKYRTAQAKLPRWVFATDEDDGTFELKRLQIDLKNVTPADSYQLAAETFANNFDKALQKYRSEQAAGVRPGPSRDGVDPAEPSPTDPSLPDGSSEEEPQAPGTSSEASKWEKASPTADANSSVTRSEASPQRIAPAPGGAPADSVRPAVALRSPGVPGTETTPTAGFGDRPASGNSGAPFRRGPDEFAGLSDERLVERLLSLSDELIESMINSLSLRTGRHQEEIRRHEPVNLSLVREFLIKEEFAAKRIGEFGSERQLWLYIATCRFAVSDQQQGSRDYKKVTAQLIRVLASDKISVWPVQDSNGRKYYYYPLADAMMKTIIPRAEDSKIAHEFVSIFKSAVGGRRGELLGYKFEPAPKAEERVEHSVTEAGFSWATNKGSAIFAFAIIAFVIICVCLGYVP